MFLIQSFFGSFSAFSLFLIIFCGVVGMYISYLVIRSAVKDGSETLLKETQLQNHFFIELLRKNGVDEESIQTHIYRNSQEKK